MTCPSLLLIAHLLSAHTHPGYENRNYGAGVECRGDRLSVAIGGFRNSYDKPTYYAVAGVRLGTFGPVSLDVLAGPASGYRSTPSDRIYLAGARVRMSLGEHLEASLLAAPPTGGDSAGVAHLMVGYRF